MKKCHPNLLLNKGDQEYHFCIFWVALGETVSLAMCTVGISHSA